MKGKNRGIWLWLNAWVLFLGCVGVVFSWGCEKADEISDKPGVKVVLTAEGEGVERAALSYWNDRLVTRNYQASYAREEKTGLPAFEEYIKLVSRNEKFRFSALKADEVKVDANAGKLDRTFKDTWIFSTSDGWLHQFSKNQP